MTGVIDLADWKLMRSIERLHPLGPRVITELLLELGARTLTRTEIDSIVSRYLTHFCTSEARR